MGAPVPAANVGSGPPAAPLPPTGLCCGCGGAGGGADAMDPPAVAFGVLFGCAVATGIGGAASAGAGVAVALIRLAADVEALAHRVSALWCRRAELEEEADGLKPDAPVRPQPPAIAVERIEGADGSLSLVVPNWTPTAQEKAAHRQFEAATKAWEAECGHVERRAGLTAAERLCYRLDARLQAAAIALTDMRPVTLAGLAAKARAAHAANPDSAFSDRWAEKLCTSIVGDVIAIGGAA